MPESKKPAVKKNRLHFLNDPKVPAGDRRVLEKFTVTQQYDNLHYATQALRSLEQGLRWWAALHEASTKFALSGLPGVPPEEVAEQEQVLQLIEALVGELRLDRNQRLRDLAETEQELEQNYWKQIRAEQAKQADHAKVLAKQAMEHQLAEREEPVVPGVQLDPKLLRQSVEALNLKEKRTKKPKKPIPAPG